MIVQEKYLSNSSKNLFSIPNEVNSNKDATILDVFQKGALLAANSTRDRYFTSNSSGKIVQVLEGKDVSIQDEAIPLFSTYEGLDIGDKNKLYNVIAIKAAYNAILAARNEGHAIEDLVRAYNSISPLKFV